MYSFDFIFGSASCPDRAKRRRPAGSPDGHKGFVVVLEMSHHLYQELDADSAEHGALLARTWCDNLGALSASVQTVNDDGSFKRGAAKLYSPDVNMYVGGEWS